MRGSGEHPPERRHGISRRAALLAAAGGVVAVGLAGCDSYRAEWRQKMTVVVETPDGERRGSAVVAVSFARGNETLMRRTEGAGVRWYVKGEAVVVNLGGGRYLFALLKGANGFLGNAGVNAYVFSDQKRGPGQIEAIKAIERTPLREPRRLPRKFYPLLVTFEDINDPTTVKKVDPDNLAATFGPGYALKAITLEITDEPVTRGRVEKVLGWIYDPKILKNPVWTSLPHFLKEVIRGLRQPGGAR